MAVPIRGCVAPFICSRNGRNVSRPMRTLVSSMPMQNRRAKPPRPRPPPVSAAWSVERDEGLRGNPKASTAATTRPRRESSHSDGRQGATESVKDKAAGIAAFPRSPAKL